jgi:hypothetical protein
VNLSHTQTVTVADSTRQMSWGDIMVQAITISSSRMPMGKFRVESVSIERTDTGWIAQVKWA